MFTRKGPLAHGRIVLLDPFVVGEGHVTGFDPCGLSRSAVCQLLAILLTIVVLYVLASSLLFILSGNGDDESTLECVEEGRSTTALE